MKHYLGLSEYHLRQKHQDYPVHYEPERLINAHLLVCGMSGTGKSFQSKQLLGSAARAGLQVDVFDVHDELEGIAGATACRYSQATGYGYNPLELDTDIHTGGVNRQTEYLLGLIREASPQLGIKQAMVLRNLIVDTYQQARIYPDNPASWQRDNITDALRQQLRKARDWAALNAYYPTLDDLKDYGRRKLTALTIGGDNPCISALEQLTHHYKRLNSLQGKYAKASSDTDLDKLNKQIATSKDHCTSSYAAFIEAMHRGRELDDILKYDSADTLASVLQRLELLNAAGIFRANPPPFGDSNARVHQIKSLTDEQQILFVKLRLRAIFERHKREGATRSGTQVRHIIFLDEAHKFFSKDSSDIINVIAREARKFGIGLWCASQSPTDFPDSFLTNVGATLILGLHPTHWQMATTKLRLGKDTLKYIKAKQVIAVQLRKEGMAEPPFGNVVVDNTYSNSLSHQSVRP
ncbi:helicase HerA-like domain-containing protein [Thiothrix sp.]|jgi:hypothetical protein|uniref:ATP-binding protein n=1 Tax=Thiothrix sp. TaxID=1032 RepID=UPI002580D031|nr:helicase HerA-like domain-containing protein [Thiothrix sp.]